MISSAHAGRYKTDKTILVDTENRLVVIRGEGKDLQGSSGGRIHCTATIGNQTHCGDHFVVYTKMELCCIPKTNLMSYANFLYLNFKKPQKMSTVNGLRLVF